MACCGPCFQGIDELIFGPLPNLAEAIQTKDTKAVQRVISFLRWTKDSQYLIDALEQAVNAGNPNVRLLTSGSTPLIHAVELGKEDIAKQLLRSRANPNERNAVGNTPFELAKMIGNQSLLDVLEKEVDRYNTTTFMDSINFVSKVPIFSSILPADYPRVAAAFSKRNYMPGECVIQQGQPGSELFFIQEGRAAVLIQAPYQTGPEKVAELTVGDVFGENALLQEVPRNATVQAIERMSCSALSRHDFEQLGLRSKLHFKKRRAVGGGPYPEDSSIAAASKKTAAEERLITQGMLANKNLGPLMKSLSAQELADIAQRACKIHAKPGETIITQDSLKADRFYVIQEGNFDIIQNSTTVFQMGPGGSFGELALLYQSPRNATVRATSDAVLWAVDRQGLKKVTQAQLRNKLDIYAKLLAKLKIFTDGVTEDDRAQMADALLETTFFNNEYIIRQGEHGQSFFILYEGIVAVEDKGRQVALLHGIPKVGKHEFFGDKALLHDEPRNASIKCVSEKATVLVLDRSVFLHVLHKDAEKNDATDKASFVTYDLKALNNIGLLGCGGFGMVTLTKCGITGNCFALKALSKGHIVKSNQTESVLNEKAILRMTNSAFLIRCAATFNSSQLLYFLLEPALGGELFTVYHRNNFFGSERHAQFYVACVLRGLTHLHQRFIIYRDLKTENLLLDNGGYCKITDFGLAKFTVGHAYTTCGTPDYFAPEMVAGTGHTVAVDWWTLGILLYEFMTADTPFVAQNPIHIFQKVQQGINKAHFPDKRKSWVDLCKGLCRSEPSERLACRTGGPQNVERHPWFANAKFQWASFDARTMQPPFKPTVKSIQDIDNFDTSDMDMPPQIHYTDTGTGWDRDFEDVRGPARFA
mmetsp:Transcript_32194/g.68485  ORF Transcript_32194/g.68485 Transcript_32194/m.68485 type:complete len:873 (-) Transcript_32194:64-2682(-)